MRAEISTFLPHVVQFLGHKATKNQHPLGLKMAFPPPLEKMHKSALGHNIGEMKLKWRATGAILTNWRNIGVIMA